MSNAQEEIQNVSELPAEEAPLAGNEDGTAMAEATPSDAPPLVGVVGSNSINEYHVSLEFFRGPMDLLLHLVSKQEVSVEEVQMTEIASQYLEIVVANAQFVDLEKAGEYLVIASTLLAIKSSALLPVETDGDEEIPSDWSDDNPFFKDLRERLRAYRHTQDQAELLRSMPQLNVDTFTRRDRKLLAPTAEMLQEPEDVFSLGSVFASLMKRIGESASFKIVAQPFSVVEFMVSIVDSFSASVQAAREEMKDSGRLGFASVLRTLRAKSTKGSNRTVVIGGFIAVLELMKRGVLAAKINEDSEFEVELRIDTSETQASSEFESEFDQESSNSNPENVVHMNHFRTADLDTKTENTDSNTYSDASDGSEESELRKVVGDT